MEIVVDGEADLTTGVLQVFKGYVVILYNEKTTLYKKGLYTLKQDYQISQVVLKSNASCWSTDYSQPANGTSDGKTCCLFYGEVCGGCQKIQLLGVIMQCERCLNAYYCNVECQRKDWKRHKKECLL